VHVVLATYLADAVVVVVLVGNNNQAYHLISKKLYKGESNDSI
jgi:hypothetical protein